MQFQLDKADTAVIVGAGHGIGFALVNNLLKQNPHIRIFASFRRKDKAHDLIALADHHSKQLFIDQLDPTNEQQLENWVGNIKKKTTKIELLINAVGVLHENQLQPEKSLDQIDSKKLLYYFSINSILTPLLAKHFLPLFRHKDPSCFVSISAKVGSIGDNKMGGWYGYRASKAALNMFVKNIGLELQRRGCQTLTLALHPGTTITDLSKPFISRTSYQLHTIDETAINLLKVIDLRDITSKQQFLSWTGESLPW